MKRLFGLINFEFRFIYTIVFTISLLLIVGQNILLYFAARDYVSGRYLPFENLISLSGVPIVFYICFALMLGSCLYIVLSNYIGGKSIYTLMTLPQNRSYIYISKLFAGVTCVHTENSETNFCLRRENIMKINIKSYCKISWNNLSIFANNPSNYHVF
ncbi:MAG: hypothetical protein ACYDG2_15945 [Ruminiclostridium sp.]